MSELPGVKTICQYTDIAGEIPMETVVTAVGKHGVALKQRLLAKKKKDDLEESVLISWAEWELIVDHVNNYISKNKH